jgi:hypothetical protein
MTLSLVTASRLPGEQARVIRAAQTAGRTLFAWSASLSDGRTLVLYAVTDRAAARLAATDGAGVVRIGPAGVRDVAQAIARALAAVPQRAARSPVDQSIPRVPRIAGEPSRPLTARCRGATFAPIASDYSLGQSARPVRLAHESRPVAPLAPAWDPKASPAIVVRGYHRSLARAS